MGIGNSRVRISSSAHLKPVPVAGFIENKENLAISLPRFYHYRKPVIKRSKDSLFIEYWYRIPVQVRHLYNKKEWHRFRIREDINKRGKDKEEYAEWLRNEIEDSLKKGYNPFSPESDFVASEEIEQEELNATDAMILFLEAWSKRGLESNSYQKYKKVINRFILWLKLKQIPYTEITNITQDHIERFLTDTKKEHGFSNREYNNHFDFLRTAFNFLLKKKFISESPCVGIDKLKSRSSKHRYYNEKNLKDISRVLKLYDPYTFLAFQTVYYLCVRSDKELMNLKVGNIIWEQNKVLAEVGKGNTERYIPLDENIKELFLEHGIDKFPDNYYVFGIEGKPALKPFGKGFFSKRFRKVREAAGMNKDFTLYSAKHTRIIHLKQDQVPDADIMSLTGHLDFSSYTKYLRDLGLTSDIKNINAKSRKI